jgi:hypothetical protein
VDFPDNAHPGILKYIFGHFGVIRQMTYKIAQRAMIAVNKLGISILVVNLTAKDQDLFQEPAT